MNQVTLIGRLGADPAVNFLPDGDMVANLRIATDESYKNKNGEKVDKTEWHRGVLFGKLATIAADYMDKGKLICLTGKLRTREYEDKDGIKRYSTEIVGSRVELLSPKSAAKAAPAPDIENPVNPDVPF